MHKLLHIHIRIRRDFPRHQNKSRTHRCLTCNTAHLALQLTKVRKDGTLNYLRPDGKSQVSVEYDEAGKPVRLEAVVLSTQQEKAPPP